MTKKVIKKKSKRNFVDAIKEIENYLVEEESEKFAYATHYLQSYGTKAEDYYKKGIEYLPPGFQPELFKMNVPFPPPETPKFTFIDLFAGIGGMRIAFQNLGGKCVFTSEWDKSAQITYKENFGEMPFGDITKIPAGNIPDHDILLAGFPCQPFSIIGKGKGFEDTRGTLFFDIARILNEKRPKAILLENVKQLVKHKNGNTFKTILTVLNDLGYSIEYKVLNALDFGLPQKRERVIIVGFRKSVNFSWPEKQIKYIQLNEILEKKVDSKYYVSGDILKKRKKSHTSKYNLAIWHENKSGHISSNPFSCALRANASYNYLLVNGERRLTERELLRLQGFPDDFRIVVPGIQIRKQSGNAVPVNMIEAVAEKLLEAINIK